MSHHMPLYGRRVSAGVCRIALSDRYVVTISASAANDLDVTDYAFLHYTQDQAYEVAYALLSAGYQAMRSAPLTVEQWNDVLGVLTDAFSTAADKRAQRQRDDQRPSADEDGWLREVAG